MRRLEIWAFKIVSFSYPDSGYIHPYAYRTPCLEMGADIRQ